MRFAMIMAGGSGTRLWPMSRASRPKQLIPFMERPEGAAGEGPMTLLEASARRLAGLVPAERRFICTGERFRDEVLRRVEGLSDERLLGEPEGRDTVNAVGFGAAVFAKLDPDAVFAVLTADHLIEPDDAFRRAMETGFELVERDPRRLVTFGIEPTHPATGFGYIERGEPVGSDRGDADGSAFRVARFVEKPPYHKAQEYLASGRFMWNSGMFVFHARTFMELVERHLPDNFAGLAKIGEAWGTESQRAVIDAAYPALAKTSVDYGIMEPAARDASVTLCGVRMDVSWLDVGSWPSFGETVEPDEAGNRSRHVELRQVDSSGNVVVSDDASHTVALVGCDDLIVVRTADATLVMPRDRAQELKKLHGGLPEPLK